MKRLTALLMVSALVVTCAGCGSDNGGAAETAPAAEETGAEDTAQEETEAAEETEAEADATEEPAEEEAAEPEEAASTSTEEKSEGVMTYAEYAAAELDTEVVVETYVQAKQSWWEDKATLYTQDQDGGYFIYELPCSEEEYEKLTPGTKIKVTGYKAEWSGEVEIIDATYEIEEGNYVAEPVDVTTYLGLGRSKIKAMVR